MLLSVRVCAELAVGFLGVFDFCGRCAGEGGHVTCGWVGDEGWRWRGGQVNVRREVSWRWGRIVRCDILDRTGLAFC